MANPVLGSTTLSCPTDSSREYILKKAEQETLGGKTRWDVMARKYRYIIHWSHMNVADYDALEGEINNLTAQTFTWDKYTSTSSGISVLAVLKERTPKTPGNQSTDFYSDVTLELTEVSSRI